jgi:hypothetical protein
VSRLDHNTEAIRSALRIDEAGGMATSEDSNLGVDPLPRTHLHVRRVCEVGVAVGLRRERHDEGMGKAVGLPLRAYIWPAAAVGWKKGTQIGVRARGGGLATNVGAYQN